MYLEMLHWQSYNDWIENIVTKGRIEGSLLKILLKLSNFMNCRLRYFFHIILAFEISWWAKGNWAHLVKERYSLSLWICYPHTVKSCSKTSICWKKWILWMFLSYTTITIKKIQKIKAWLEIFITYFERYCPPKIVVNHFSMSRMWSGVYINSWGTSSKKLSSKFKILSSICTFNP